MSDARDLLGLLHPVASARELDALMESLRHIGYHLDPRTNRTLQDVIGAVEVSANRYHRERRRRTRIGAALTASNTHKQA